jgi:hypothetical protein
MHKKEMNNNKWGNKYSSAAWTATVKCLIKWICDKWQFQVYVKYFVFPIEIYNI